MNVLITGATGFIGSELLRMMLVSGYAKRVYVVIRKSSEGTGKQRLDRMYDYWDKFGIAPDRSTLDCVEVVEHDLNEDGFPHYDDVDIVFHSAASTELGRKLNESRIANVFATQRVLTSASKSKSLKRFVHFSTAYVSGKRKGMVREDAPYKKVRNPYEQSKREGEQCVRSFGLPYTILRPSIVVGNSKNGYIWRIKVLYSVFRMWLSGLVPRAPLDKTARVDIVPVDFVVDAALKLATSSKSEGKAVHLCSGQGAVSPMTILESAVNGLEFKMPPISPQWAATLLAHWPIRKLVGHSLGEVLDAMRWHIPYLGAHGITFDTARAEEMLSSEGIKCPNYDEYSDVLFSFLKETSWGKKGHQLN